MSLNLGGWSIPTTHDPQQAGQPTSIGPGDRDLALTWGDTAVAQVSTLTYSGSSAISYTVPLVLPDGTSTSIVFTGGASDTATATALVAAIDANNAVGAWLTATSSAGVVTLTASTAGTAGAFTVTASADCTAATPTAASDGATLAFDRLVGVDPATRTARLPVLTAQADTITCTYTSGSPTITVSISSPFDAFPPIIATATAATSATATATAVAAAVNAAAPASTVIATSAAGVVTLTSEVNGHPITTSVYVTGAGATAVAATSPLRTDDLRRELAGVALISGAFERTAPGVAPVIPPGAGIRVRAIGSVAASIADTPNAVGQVWVANTGIMYAAAGSGRIPLPTDVARITAYNSTTQVADIALNFTAVNSL